MITCPHCGRSVDAIVASPVAHLCDRHLDELVPGYLDSADGRADLADQIRYSRREGQR